MKNPNPLPELSAKRIGAIPRRACLDECTPAELVIRNAMIEVELLGADPELTFIVMDLQKIRERVADWLEGKTGTNPA